MVIRNVIVVNDFLQVNGGAAQVAVAHAVGMKKKGLRVVYFCGVNGKNDELEKAGIEVVCLNGKSILDDKRNGIFFGVWNLKARRALREILTQFQPEDTVVHIHGWVKCLSPSILNVADRMGFKTFITLHDFFAYCPNGGLYQYPQRRICHLRPMSWKCVACNCDVRSYSQKIWRCIRQVIQDYVLKRLKYTHFISISALSHRLFCEYLPQYSQSVERVNNPVDIGMVSALVEDSHRTDYLFIGRLSEEKGIKLFLKTAAELHVHVSVWGSGSLLDELKKEFPNVNFEGWVNPKDMNHMLSNVRCLVFPSVWYETFGLVVAEMLSRNIPCIVGDQTAAAELIVEGINGYTFKMGDADSLKQAILKMEKTWMEMNPASTFEASKYSMETHIQTLLAYYEAD